MFAISGYQIQNKIYESQRTRIFKAIREADSTPVFLKMPGSDFASPEEIARFLSEYELLRGLRHEGIISVYDLLRIQNIPILILEDFQGIPLSDIVRAEPLSIDEVLNLAGSLITAIGSIHRSGIIHKDINPSNIIWNRKTETVKLIDFGLSARLDRENPEIRSPGLIEGTLAYISPEQTGRVNRTVDFRSDYYSLGVTLYTVLNGKPPFVSEDPSELVHSHIARHPPRLSDIVRTDGDRLPQPVSAIVEKLMAKSPEERYHSIYGLRSDIARAREYNRDGGHVADFAPGLNDVSDEFRIPEKLYGFEGRIAQLHDLFQSVNRERSISLIVSGESGAGKTALVKEIYRWIVPGRGFYIAGKYQKLNSDVPYSGIVAMLRDLTVQLLQDSDEGLRRWREEIITAVHGNGRILIDLVPELELVVGSQPDLEELGPSEAHNRFLYTVSAFLRVFTSGEQPLVLVLDDLQWSDVPSLRLIQYLLADQNVSNLFFIGLYRSEEDEEPLKLTLDEMRGKGNFHELTIEPLPVEAVLEMLTDLFHCTQERAADLTVIIHRFGQGNPFFTRELLKDMHESGIVVFDRDQGVWDWDLARFRNEYFGENIVELLRRRLGKLGPQQRRLLSLAACLGSSFDFQTLGLLHQTSRMETAEALWDALEQGILIPLTANYRIFHFLESINDNSMTGSDVHYRFQHDRLRQAAYDQVPEKDRPALHLQIGRLLVANTDFEKEPERLIDIVHHMNYALPLISDQEEQERLRLYNIMAAEKARGSNAYSTALQFTTVALSLLPPNPWKIDYDLTNRVYRLQAQLLYLCDRSEEGDSVCNEMVQQSTSNYEKASVREMQATYYNYLWRMEDSINACIEGLRFLKIRISARPGMLSVLTLLIRTRLALRRKTLEELRSMPEIQNRNVKLALKLLINFIPPSYMSGNGNLFATAALRKTLLAIEHGNSIETAGAYMGYAVLMAGIGDHQAAYDFGRLGLRISDNQPGREWKSMIYNLYALFSVSWNEHWNQLHVYFARALEMGLQSGDWLYVAFAAGFINLWNPELDLKRLTAENEHYLALIKRANIETAHLAAIVNHQRWMAFRGLTQARGFLSDSQYREDEILDRMGEIKYESGIAIFHLNKMEISFSFDQFDRARQHRILGQQSIKALAGSPYMVSWSLFSFLTEGSLVTENLISRQFALRFMKREYGRMKKWAHHSPENFSHLKLLMEAELARYRRNYFKAVNLYNRAIEAALNYRNLHHIALIYELAARFHLQHGVNHAARELLRSAYNYYRSWGAAGKIMQLEENYGGLLMDDERAVLVAPTSSSSGTGKIAFDSNTLIKASLAISGELVLDRLLDRLLKLSMENAGAQRGIMFLLRDGKIRRVANGYADRPTEVVNQTDADDESGYALSAIRYVTRTKQNLIIDDAMTDSRFLKDPYIRQFQTKSMLCIPVIHLGENIAILYLENSLVRGAFTNDRIALLQLLSGQMAASIHNAELYASLDQKVQERTTELQIERNKLEARNAIMERDIALARRIQYSLIPAYPPLHTMATLYRPMEQLGGDFFDFIKLSGTDAIGIFLSDVSGHGVTAAFVTSMIKTILLQGADRLWDPAALLQYMNGVLMNQTSGNFVTIFYGIYRPTEKTLLYSSAGHNSPFLLTPGKMTEIPVKRKVPVGIFSNAELIAWNRCYENAELKLPTGGRLLFYTDGLLETRSADGSTFFEETGLQRALVDNLHIPPTFFRDRLYETLEAFHGSSSFDDDICIISLDIV